MVKPLYYNRLTNFSRFPLEIPKPLSVLADGCLDPLLKQVALLLGLIFREVDF